MQEVNMIVSGVIRKKGEKYVRISFQRDKDMAEFILPGSKLDKSQGFDEGELKQLEFYVTSNQADIMEQARKVNPMKAMLGMTEG